MYTKWRNSPARNRILGILNRPDAQVTFVDAPGVHVAKNELDAAMDRAIERALDDADAVLCFLDPTRAPGQEDRLVLEQAGKARGKVFLCVNKKDASTPAEYAPITLKSTIRPSAQAASASPRPRSVR